MRGINTIDHFKANLLLGEYVHMYTSGQGQRIITLAGKMLAAEKVWYSSIVDIFYRIWASFYWRQQNSFIWGHIYGAEKTLPVSHMVDLPRRCYLAIKLWYKISPKELGGPACIQWSQWSILHTQRSWLLSHETKFLDKRKRRYRVFHVICFSKHITDLTPRKKGCKKTC